MSNYKDVGALALKYQRLRNMTQGEVAVLLSEHLGRKITQGMVSDHLMGVGWGRAPELFGAYVTVLDIPQQEMVQALGFSDVGEDGRRSEPTLAELIQRDPNLSAQAKAHFLSQYNLLVEASAYRRTKRKPAAESTEDLLVRAVKKTVAKRAPAKKKTQRKDDAG